MNIGSRIAPSADAGSVCHVLVRSITECCAEDHRDDPALLHLWLHNKTPDNVRAWLDAPECFAIVAEVGRSIVGFAIASGNQIALCYVVPEALHTGVGKAMLQAMEVHAAGSGIQTLQLESTRTAKAFYLRNGFVSAGPPVFAFGMEGQPMAKRLEQSRMQPIAHLG